MPFLELRMLKLILLFVSPYLVEAVHVELPHKRREVGVFKVLREDVVGKSSHIPNNKRVAFGRPADNGFVFTSL